MASWESLKPCVTASSVPWIQDILDFTASSIISLIIHLLKANRYLPRLGLITRNITIPDGNVAYRFRGFARNRLHDLDNMVVLGINGVLEAPQARAEYKLIEPNTSSKPNKIIYLGAFLNIIFPLISPGNNSGHCGKNYQMKHNLGQL